MATKQNLIFKDAEKAKAAIMKSQQEEIKDLYVNWAKDIGKKADMYAKKTTPSSALQEIQMKTLKKQLTAASKQISNEVYDIIKNNMYLMSDAVVGDSKKWMKSLGFEDEAANIMFSNIPDSTVRNIVTGQIYESGWSLSKAIWSDNEKNLKDIYAIVGKGVAENSSIYDIAKELETYVNPDKKLPWNFKGKDGVKIFKKSVDYNAQRLARTLVQHGYQQSFMAATKDNPLVEEYVWLSNGSRVCPICKARNGKHYSKDNLPMDHPNGMCTMVPVINNNMIDDLADWVNNPDKYPKLTNFAKKLGYKESQVKAGDVVKIKDAKTIQKAEKTVKAKTKKVPKFTNAQEKYLTKYGYSIDNMPKDYDEWFYKLTLDDTVKLSKWGAKENKSVKELFDKYLNVVKYKTEKVDDIIDSSTSSKKVQAFSDIQEKYLKPYGFTKDKMPIDFDDWSHKVSYGQASEILESMGTSWSDPHPYQQLMKFYNQHLTDKNFTTKTATTVKKAASATKSNDAKFDSAAWHEAIRNNNLRTMESWCDDWLRAISSEERNGVEVYTGSAYFDMNEYLRGQKSSTMCAKEIKQATAALKKASLPEEVIVRRGSDYNMLRELGVDISEANKDKLIGAIVTDKGFMSTSPASDGGFSGNIEYIVKVPKGSQAMYVDTISQNRGEEELLINRGGKYIIEDVEFDSYGDVNKIYMTLKNLKGPK